MFLINVRSDLSLQFFNKSWRFFTNEVFEIVLVTYGINFYIKGYLNDF